MHHSPKINDGQSILTLDIGGGTQDLLVWTEGEPLKNALQCILPSPTIMIARKINKATREGNSSKRKSRRPHSLCPGTR